MCGPRRLRVRCAADGDGGRASGRSSHEERKQYTCRDSGDGRLGLAFRAARVDADEQLGTLLFMPIGPREGLVEPLVQQAIRNRHVVQLGVLAHPLARPGVDVAGEDHRAQADRATDHAGQHLDVLGGLFALFGGQRRRPPLRALPVVQLKGVTLRI
jgi:hypothetical protein